MENSIQYKDVQAILKKLAGGTNPTHDGKGAFWDKEYEQFMASTPIYGQVLIVLGKPEESALIKALRGDPPFDDEGFGRMPLGGPYATEEEIGKIASWVKNNCPK
jgi:hypothetical protein